MGPAGQSAQELLPLDIATVPAPHVVQVLLAVAPRAELTFPIGQLVHTDIPELGPYLPAWQSSHSIQSYAHASNCVTRL